MRNDKRYTKKQWTKIVFTGMSPDGDTFVDYTTKSGHTLSSMYDQDIKFNIPVSAFITYDIDYSKWRLIAVR